MILGIPVEDQSHVRETARQLAELPIDALKLHNLHVCRDTELANRYLDEPFHLPDPYEYLELLIDFLRRIPPHLPLMRLVTDTPESERLAPDWPIDKGQFLHLLAKHMRLRGYRQGDLCEPHRKVRLPETGKTRIKTEDASFTFWNEEVREHYHSRIGARREAEEKYLKPSALAERLKDGDVRVLDVCFGLGYNSLVMVDCWRSFRAGGTPHGLRIDAIEIDRVTTAAA
ncbi:MAG: radical SAM protein, partial [Lentisphaerae bacterium]